MSKLDKMNAFADDLRALARDVMDEFARAPKPGLGGHGLVFLARATTSLESVQALANAGLVADATSVSRTVIELCIELGFLAKEDSERRFELFFGYEHVRDWLQAQALANLHGPATDRAAMKILEDRYRQVKANYPSDHKWASSLKQFDSLRKRAVSLGGAYVHFYELAYAEACSTSHAGPDGLRHAYSTAEDAQTVTVTLLVGRGDPSAAPIQLACWGFISVVALAINLCELQAQFDDRHDELVRHLSVITATK